MTRAPGGDKAGARASRRSLRPSPQVAAFLRRQTGLLLAAAKTGRAPNVKRGVSFG